MKDLGAVSTWEEAFAKARELYGQGEINAVGTISLREFKKGVYFAALLSDSPLDLLAEVSPQIYQGDSFHLFRRGCQVGGESVESLLIVYLTKGETITEPTGRE